MDDEICTIDISQGMLDNQYTFFEDGRIRHFFDENIYRPNLERWILANEIRASDKVKLLEKCSPKLKDRIKLILEQ